MIEYGKLKVSKSKNLENKAMWLIEQKKMFSIWLHMYKLELEQFWYILRPSPLGHTKNDLFSTAKTGTTLLNQSEINGYLLSKI